MRSHQIKRPGGADCAPRSLPSLLLVCEASSTTLTDGRWQFAIEHADGTPVLEAADEEPGDLNRLTLLAAIRGLEAIDGPAAVTLLSNNRYLVSSLVNALPRWRQQDFAWEHFGRVIDVQHADLWRRIDRALQIHRVEACLVSSRLVSSGSEAMSDRNGVAIGHDPTGSSATTAEAEWTRVDDPHPTIRRPAAAKQPEDRLRRWLLGGAGTAAGPTRRRRFTSADLAEST